ncbi:MAG: hypothetical protein ACFB12_17810, partial [Leptolyngbyaceae cyanobacterium]
VDTHWFRGNSYFRIGCEWVKAALQQGWRLTQQVCFCGNRDPEPAMALRRQHQHNNQRLEFTVRSFVYKPD